jgi:hypothetical protein
MSKPIYAFPTAELDVPLAEAGGPDHRGMTLRDYFAAKAMLAVIAHPAIPGPDDQDHDGVAELAFRFADAMLAAREKGGN